MKFRFEAPLLSIFYQVEVKLPSDLSQFRSLDVKKFLPFAASDCKVAPHLQALTKFDTEKIKL